MTVHITVAGVLEAIGAVAVIGVVGYLVVFVLCLWRWGK